MKDTKSRRYDVASEFFDLDGHAWMLLSPQAAIEVCEQASHRGLVVARVEGGIWHAGLFEPRIDCIWDGADPPIDVEAAAVNNARAADFIRLRSDHHDTFVLTAPPIAGWPHRQRSS
jgi:hypothetical protein